MNRIHILVVEEQTGNAISELPDGFEDLSKYNLITYKSLRQPLDSWSLDELICYYVLYRKLVSPSLDNLMPTDQFRLFGISTRYPQNLCQIEHLEYVKNGIYRLIRGEFEISILVLSRMPLNQRDAIWNMFATKQKQIQFGLENYRWKSNDFKQSVINNLFQKYQSENIMPYTKKDFIRDTVLNSIHEVPVEDVVKCLNINDVLKTLKPEQRLNGLKPEERLSGLKPEERLFGLKPEERLNGLKPEERLSGLNPKDLEILEYHINMLKKKSL